MICKMCSQDICMPVHSQFTATLLHLITECNSEVKFRDFPNYYQVEEDLTFMQQ